jgi:hypothetical protein
MGAAVQRGHSGRGCGPGHLRASIARLVLGLTTSPPPAEEPFGELTDPERPGDLIQVDRYA